MNLRETQICKCIGPTPIQNLNSERSPFLFPCSLPSLLPRLTSPKNRNNQNNPTPENTTPSLPLLYLCKPQTTDFLPSPSPSQKKNRTLFPFLHSHHLSNPSHLPSFQNYATLFLPSPRTRSLTLSLTQTLIPHPSHFQTSKLFEIHQNLHGSSPLAQAQAFLESLFLFCMFA